MKGSVKEPNMFHNYETDKITHKAENLQLYRVVWFFRPRSSLHDAFNVTVCKVRWYMRRAWGSRVEELNKKL